MIILLSVYLCEGMHHTVCNGLLSNGSIWSLQNA